jgi:lipid A 3-O-deacylase
MPSILRTQQGKANKNNNYQGIILILTVMLLMLRSPLAVEAQEASPQSPQLLPQEILPQETKEQVDRKPPQHKVRQNHTVSPNSPQSSPIQQEQGDSLNIASPLETAFGAKGQKHWYVQGAVATTLDREEAFPQRFVLAGAGLSKFLFDGHSINLELNSIYFRQPDDDALGLNLSLLMRWHLLRNSSWSLFVDGGAGVMGTTSDVPSKGASFNFTPQVGAGVSIKLKEQRQLMLGLRWHHISHADLFGANPGRDSLMGYVGVQFPR